MSSIVNKRQEQSEHFIEEHSTVRRRDPFMGCADVRLDFSFSQPHLCEIFTDV